MEPLTIRERRLLNTIGVLINRKKKSFGPTEIKKESYPFIPIDTTRLFYYLEFAYEELYKDRRGEIFNFVDYGAGIGNVLDFALGYGFTVKGFEVVEEYLQSTNNIFIEKGDLTDPKVFSSKRKYYDVVYYYCPFLNSEKEIEFELRAIETLKIGGILIAPGPGRFSSFFSHRKHGWHGDIKGENAKTLYNKTSNFEQLGEGKEWSYNEVFKRIK